LNLPRSYENEWFEEGNVPRRIKKFLQEGSYIITRFNSDKRSRGPDIVCEKDAQQMVIEVKGYPWDRYAKDIPRWGIKKGDPKPTPPNLQAKHWFAQALLTLLIEKQKGKWHLLGLGLPKFEIYQGLLRKIHHKELGITCLMVDKEGHVEII
jgi:hypothetical protein